MLYAWSGAVRILEMSRKLLIARTALLLLASLLFALLGNFAHPNGLELGRDYFPRQGHDFAHDYLSMSAEDAHDYWQYRADEVGGVYFVDARRKKSFNQGHIPGALNIDRYQDYEKIDPELIAKLKLAGMVIVYCNGGECEDSIFLANDLVYRWQVPADVLAVFGGGMEQWLAAGYPQE